MKIDNLGKLYLLQLLTKGLTGWGNKKPQDLEEILKLANIVFQGSKGFPTVKPGINSQFPIPTPRRFNPGQTINFGLLQD